MNENDVIAEYVKEQYPELLETFEFAIFRLKKAAEKMANDFAESLKSIDFSKVTEELIAMKEGKQNGES